MTPSGFDVLPVTIVTGFLGSGKTTMIAELLRSGAAADTAVLVNEFGEIGLDHLILGEVGPNTVLLQNGCVCCSIRGELKQALVGLFGRRIRGQTPPFRRVVLETTGLATPAPIMATLLADPLVRHHFELAATVTVIDALNWRIQRERNPEWLAQATGADRFVIRKDDLVDDAEVRELAAALRLLNPAACVVPRDDVSQALLEPAGHSMQIPAVTTHSSYIQAFTIDLSGAAPDWIAFTLWLTMLLNRHGDRILRVKGLLEIAGWERPVLLNGVQHLVHPVVHLQAWPPEAARRSFLVFITQGITRDEIQNSWDRFAVYLAA
jgi:G3E family GTPase